MTRQPRSADLGLDRIGEQTSLFDDELPDLIDRSIAILRENEPADGYYGCFSGGKDSIVIKRLAAMAGVKVGWHYNVTTIDPPELVRFIRREHPDVIWERPKHGNFFRRMEKKGFPTRRARWCCDEYKESRSPNGATLILGIRAEESSARAARWSEVMPHFRTGAATVQPILRWASDEIWTFIRAEGLAYCSLYDEGFHRLGCICCPMATAKNRRAELARWPRYERLWMRTFERIWERRTCTLQRDGRPWFGDVYFRDWREMWEWWLSDSALPPRLVEDFALFPDQRKTSVRIVRIVLDTEDQ